MLGSHQAKKKKKKKTTEDHWSCIAHLSAEDMLKSAVETARKPLRVKVTPDLHLTYSENGGNLGLVLKMKNIACISILLTKHVKYTNLYLLKFVLYSIVAFKAKK